MYLKDMVKDLDVTEHVDHLEWYDPLTALFHELRWLASSSSSF